ncbi:MAG: S41 family peptidase [Chloroflexota bacterium]|nr:S41 family peptidase [Chloroflexota bacterium]
MSRKWYVSCLQVFFIGLVALLLVGSGFAAGYVIRSLLPHLTQAEVPATPAGGSTGEFAQRNEAFDLFWEAWGFIKQDFYGELPDEKEMTYGAIRGVIHTLNDPHTMLVDPQTAAIAREDMKGEFEGIGATVRMDEEGYLVIVQPFEDQPAAKAGLLPGDIILKADGTSIQGMDIYQAISHIRGPAGTEVQLLVQRLGEEEPFLVSVVRGKIEIPTVRAKILAEDVAYLRLNDFHGKAIAQVRRALRSLLDQEPSGLILDLRNNPGGLLDTAVDISGLFLRQDQVILIELRKGGERKTYRAEGRPLVTDIPLVVLINGGSASASEIVAGAIKDNDRGVLLGEPTFGKGSVQLPHQLSDGSELHITIAQWLTPSGHALRDGNSLLPDIPVSMTSRDFQAGRDPQLNQAIEYLTSQQESRELTISMEEML